jgi:HEAT repeat protein
LLADLSDEDKPLKYSRLLQVSGLSSGETVEFKLAWASVQPTRKREIVEKLVDLCEDNLELDFIRVFRICLEDKDEDVREKAARGIWECDDRSIIRPLIDLLRDDPSAKVRAAVSISLGKFAVMAQNGKLLPRDADRIQEALMAVIGRQDEELEVRRRAIEAVASYNLPELDQIIRNAYASGELKLMQSSIYAMGRSSNSRWLSDVLTAMDHEDASIRYEAAAACGQLGGESTAPQLIKLIQDEDVQVQLAAVMALGNVGGQLARRALHKCLKIEDEALADAATDALGHIEFDDTL